MAFSSVIGKALKDEQNITTWGFPEDLQYWCLGQSVGSPDWRQTNGNLEGVGKKVGEMGYAAILWICLVSECNVLLEQWQMSIQGLLSSSVTSTGGFQTRCFQTPDPCFPLYQRHACNTETVGTASPQQFSVERNQKGAYIFIYIYFFVLPLFGCFMKGGRGDTWVRKWNHWFWMTPGLAGTLIAEISQWFQEALCSCYGKSLSLFLHPN